MKVKTFAVVRVVRYPTSGAVIARVVDSYRDERSAEDALEHLYEQELPALARKHDWFYEGYDWETDHEFGYQLHRRDVDGQFYHWKNIAYSVQELNLTV